MKILKGILSGVVAISLAALSYSTPIVPITQATTTIASENKALDTKAEGNISNEPISVQSEKPQDNVLSSTVIFNSLPTEKQQADNKPVNALPISSSTASKIGSSASKNTSITPVIVQTPKEEAKPALAEPSPTPKPAPEPPKPVIEAPKPAPPSKPTSDKLVLGYGTYYSSKDVSSLNSLKSHSSLIDTLATHTYIVDINGNLYIQGNLFPTSQMSFASSNGIKTLAVVRNEFNGELAHTILNSSESTANLINNIEKSLQANSYSGVNIDFEILYSKDRDAFTSFMRDLYNRLKPKGYLVTIALPAKTSEAEKWVYAYDYAKLGSYSDQVILMTYDEHYPGGSPGAVASLSWTQRVVNYAASVIPREKLLLGLAAYGYDWTVKDGKTISTKSLSVSAAYSTASTNGAEILWDSTAQVPYYTYTDSNGDHFVYFENSTSISYKLNIVNNSNLKGIAIWRLGLEDEAYWTTIKSKLNK